MITGRDLMDKLPLPNQRLDTRTEAAGLGGTAMTLLGIKNETRDVGFILEEGDTTSFKSISERVCGTVVDVFGRCSAYSVRMPDDYVFKSNLVAKLDMLAVYAMSPLDIIITKMARGEDRDFEDSKNCLEFGNYSEDDIRNRMPDYEPDSRMAENVGRLVGWCE